MEVVGPEASCVRSCHRQHRKQEEEPENSQNAKLMRTRKKRSSRERSREAAGFSAMQYTGTNKLQ